MRGVETRIQEIRHRIFREVARMAYHTEWPVDKRIEELPYKIIPGEVGNFRNDVFLERAIVGERLRLAMGLPYRGIQAADGRDRKSTFDPRKDPHHGRTDLIPDSEGDRRAVPDHPSVKGGRMRNRLYFPSSGGTQGHR